MLELITFAETTQKDILSQKQSLEKVLNQSIKNNIETSKIELLVEIKLLMRKISKKLVILTKHSHLTSKERELRLLLGKRNKRLRDEHAQFARKRSYDCRMLEIPFYKKSEDKIKKMKFLTSPQIAKTMLRQGDLGEDGVYTDPEDTFIDKEGTTQSPESSDYCSTSLEDSSKHSDFTRRRTESSSNLCCQVTGRAKRSRRGKKLENLRKSMKDPFYQSGGSLNRLNRSSALSQGRKPKKSKKLIKGGGKRTEACSLLKAKARNSKTGVKRGEYQKFTLEERIRILNFARLNGVKKTSNKFDIDRKRVRRWLENGVYHKKGGGRTPKDPEMEKKLVNWIVKECKNRFENGVKKMVPNIMIRRKAVELSTVPDFMGSKGWMEKFGIRHEAFMNHARSCLMLGIGNCRCLETNESRAQGKPELNEQVCKSQEGI